MPRIKPIAKEKELIISIDRMLSGLQVNIGEIQNKGINQADITQLTQFKDIYLQSEDRQETLKAELIQATEDKNRSAKNVQEKMRKLTSLLKGIYGIDNLKLEEFGIKPYSYHGRKTKETQPQTKP